MVLDKTGTLTQGQTRVVRAESDEALLHAAAAIEHGSNHPLARAIIDAADTEAHPIAEQINQTPGAGIEGVVEGQTYWVGSPAFVREMIAVDQRSDDAISSMLAEGLTPVVIANDLGNIGVLGIGDPLREDTVSAIESLKARGWSLHLCSGDHPAIADQLAKQVGIDHAMGGASPERKAELVRSLREQGHERIVMVGDGFTRESVVDRTDMPPPMV